MADGIAAWFNKYPDPATTPTYNAGDERLLSTVLAMPASPLLARPGVRPGGSPTVTVDGTAMTVTVGPFSGIITDTGAGGSFKFAIPAAVTKSLGTRPGGGTSRIDEIVARIKNDEVRPADSAREVEIFVRLGTAGSSPSAPAIAAGELRVAELAVPSSGTILVSKPAQRTAALGGTLNVATQAEEDALAGSLVWDGLQIYREDTDELKIRANGAWVVLNTAKAVRFHAQRLAAQAIPQTTLTDIIFDTELVDSAASWSAPSAVYTIPASGDGDYKVTGRVGLDNTAGGTFSIHVSKNGATAAVLYRGDGTVASSPRVAGGSTDLLGLVAGDTIGLSVRQQTGATRNTATIAPASAWCPEIIIRKVA